MIFSHGMWKEKPPPPAASVCALSATAAFAVASETLADITDTACPAVAGDSASNRTVAYAAASARSRALASSIKAYTRDGTTGGAFTPDTK